MDVNGVDVLSLPLRANPLWTNIGEYFAPAAAVWSWTAGTETSMWHLQPLVVYVCNSLITAIREPIIFHGHTFTSKILFRDVIEVRIGRTTVAFYVLLLLLLFFFNLFLSRLGRYRLAFYYVVSFLSF